MRSIEHAESQANLAELQQFLQSTLGFGECPSDASENCDSAPHALDPLLEDLSDALIVVDLVGKITKYSAATLNLFALEKADLSLGWPFGGQLFTPDVKTLLPAENCPVAQALGGTSIDRVPLFFRSPRNPSGIWIEITSRPLLGTCGTVRGAVALIKRPLRAPWPEAALKISNDRFQALAYMVNDVVWEWDPRKGTVWRHPGTRGAFGYPEEQVRSQQDWWEKNVHPEDAPEILADLARMAAGETKVWRKEYRFRRADGTYAYVLDQGHSLPGEKNAAPHLILGAMMDITDRKEAEIQVKKLAGDLARSNKELEEFAFVASHDLQEPLRMISSYLKVLTLRYHGKLDAEADEFMGFIFDGANRMRSLIDNLLAYCRAEPTLLNVRPVDCTLVAEQVKDDFALTIRETGARLEYHDLPVVHGDPIQIGQIFRNLLSNALKFRGEVPPVVKISCDRQPGRWVFKVSDNGTGFDVKKSKTIFKIFKRLHSRTRYPGNGIGLALCKKIVERHGGRIWVESALGRGSDFYFSLPQPPPTSSTD